MSPDAAPSAAVRGPVLVASARCGLPGRAGSPGRKSPATTPASSPGVAGGCGPAGADATPIDGTATAGAARPMPASFCLVRASSVSTSTTAASATAASDERRVHLIEYLHAPGTAMYA